jgi:hypothetical protein
MSSAANERYPHPADAEEAVLTPVQKIWRHVLKQVYADAELPLGAEHDEELFVQQELARSILRADTEDEEACLKLVCGFAGVPYDRVVLWARQRYPLGA